MYTWSIVTVRNGRFDVAVHGVGDSRASAMQRAEEVLRRKHAGAVGVVREVPMNVLLPLRDIRGRLLALGHRPYEGSGHVLWSTVDGGKGC